MTAAITFAVMVSLAAPPTAASEVEQLIRQLGAPAFAVREQASRKLAEIGEPALPALRTAMKDRDPEVRRRAETIVRALTDLSPEQRAEVAASAAKAFAAADYVTAARQHARIARLRRPTIAECAAVGHDWQLAERWADAVAGYLRAVERIEEVLNGDPETDPPPMPPVPLNGPGIARRPVAAPGFPDHVRRELIRQRAGLLLLAGRLQRDQAGDAAGAVTTFARIIDSIPEFKCDLPVLLDTLASDAARRRARQEVPQDVGRGLQLINEFEVLDELARTQARLGRVDDAIHTLARLNATRMRTRPDGTDESLAEMSRLIQRSPAVRVLPAAAKLVELTPPPSKPERPAATPRPDTPGSPLEWVATNLGEFGLGHLHVRDLARMPDGRWVGAIAAGTRLYVATSRDLTTWDRPRVVPASVVGNNLDPAITVDDRGVVWLATFSNRLSSEPQGSGGYLLWLSHTADLANWSPPRSIAADSGSGWPLGTMQWLRVGRDLHLYWRAAAATVASPAQLTRLEPLAIPQDKPLWLLDPHVSRDAGGRFHLVANDFNRGVVYTSSTDAKAWSEPRWIVPPVHERSVGGEPHLLIDGDRVALIYHDVMGTSLRRGKLAELTSLSPPVALGPVGGTRWHRVGDHVVGFGGGDSPWLLRAPVADLVGGR